MLLINDNYSDRIYVECHCHTVPQWQADCKFHPSAPLTGNQEQQIGDVGQLTVV